MIDIIFDLILAGVLLGLVFMWKSDKKRRGRRGRKEEARSIKEEEKEGEKEERKGERKIDLRILNNK